MNGAGCCLGYWASNYVRPLAMGFVSRQMRRITATMSNTTARKTGMGQIDYILVSDVRGFKVSQLGVRFSHMGGKRRNDVWGLCSATARCSLSRSCVKAE